MTFERGLLYAGFRDGIIFKDNPTSLVSHEGYELLSHKGSALDTMYPLSNIALQGEVVSGCDFSFRIEGVISMLHDYFDDGITPVPSANLYRFLEEEPSYIPAWWKDKSKSHMRYVLPGTVFEKRGKKFFLAMFWDHIAQKLGYYMTPGSAKMKVGNDIEHYVLWYWPDRKKTLML